MPTVRSRRRRSTYALPLAGLAAVVAVAGCGSKTGTASGPIVPTGATSPSVLDPTPSSGQPSVTPSPSSTPAPSVTPSSTPSPTPLPTHAGLRTGDKGDQVVDLQRKLQSMGFWLSEADGSYGQTTEQAVMAFQKAKGLDRDGVAGPLTLRALRASTGAGLVPQSTAGHVLEVDKARQLLLIVDNGVIRQIFNTSTGSNQTYMSGGVTSLATTPSGRFAMFRQVDALDPGPLGDLWRPKYFNGGIAIHGSPSIPGYPASHGCARLSNPAIDWIWNSNQSPMGTAVRVY